MSTEPVEGNMLLYDSLIILSPEEVILNVYKRLNTMQLVR
jgi:hypothetical protein